MERQSNKVVGGVGNQGQNIEDNRQLLGHHITILNLRRAGVIIRAAS